jgi:predicted nucleic acid-binding protein
MIIDTDVLVWYMRGNENARMAINKAGNFSISAISYMELVQGMRNKNELNSLREALKTWKSDILYITEEISAKAVFIVEQYYLSHSIQVTDALIGSTGVVCGMPILTANDKHYKVINDLNVKKFRP